MSAVKGNSSNKGDSSPAVNGMAMITVNDPEQRFNPGPDLWKALEKPHFKDISNVEISNPGMCLADSLSGYNVALIVDSTSNGTKCGTVSLIDLSLSNKKATRIEIPSKHGRLIASELTRMRNEGTLPERVLLLGVEGPADGSTESTSATVSADKCVPLHTASLILSTLLETFSKKIAS